VVFYLKKRAKNAFHFLARQTARQNDIFLLGWCYDDYWLFCQWGCWAVAVAGLVLGWSAGLVVFRGIFSIFLYFLNNYKIIYIY